VTSEFWLGPSQHNKSLALRATRGGSQLHVTLALGFEPKAARTNATCQHTTKLSQPGTGWD